MTNTPLDPVAPPQPTNMEIGAAIGLGHSAVSRLRTGIRKPSIAVIGRVSRAFSWPVADQLNCIEQGTYFEEFGRRAEAWRNGLSV